MARRGVRRALVAAGVLAVAGVSPVVVAGPASANSTAQCSEIVRHYGYEVGAQVVAACGHSALAYDIPNPSCLLGLERLGVKSSVANKACSYA